MSEDLILTVKKGAHLLDEKYPKWHESIDLDTLELQRADLCVLGQLGRAHYGSYDSEVGYLGINPREYGFDLPMEWTEDGWEELTALWVNQIRLRQLAP